VPVGLVPLGTTLREKRQHATSNRQSLSVNSSFTSAGIARSPSPPSGGTRRAWLPSPTRTGA